MQAWLALLEVMAVNTATPPPRVISIPYVTPGTSRQVLDVYAPVDARGAPVIVFFHGGVWQVGDRSDYANVGQAFAAHGVVAVVAGYRLTPSVRHPAHVQDAAAAVAYVVRHAPEWGGDGRRVFVAGHSAGGHLASLMLMDPRWLAAAGVDAETLGGVIPMSGIFDLQRPISSRGDGGFKSFIHPPFTSSAAALREASPVTHVRRTRVPMLVVLAGEDDPAMQAQSHGWMKRLQEGGVAARLDVVPGQGHFELVTTMDPGSVVVKDVIQFIRHATPATRAP